MKDIINENKKDVQAAKRDKKAVKKIRRRESHKFLFDMVSVLFSRG
ncbi:hypothetical protein CcarbDRAFT_1914 [Clostridium carboxidivorans P7]|uniref:Uncharacterized protein n=1 Tax=Clostridium carboxidivorans P7 TaxID=536227 RepID=C6PSZ7_9CLOT|nr:MULTISPECIES: hypothetical protein [Clostridium]EET87632.1 hypothetical protein CcarbDRAFT_1914 [Clostridium carboxidivorans P7]WPC42860.1 hypothetical protein Q6H37_05150 [Clostridium sp. JS66]